MKVFLEMGAIMPTRAHKTDAGLDLYATESKYVFARSSTIFDTGVHIELPRGTVGILKSKSGLNVRHDIISDGVIDLGYTGSIKVKLYNLGHVDYFVRAGDKITQLVVVPIMFPKCEQVKSLEEFADTERGGGGFGSTGR